MQLGGDVGASPINSNPPDMRDVVPPSQGDKIMEVPTDLKPSLSPTPLGKEAVEEQAVDAQQDREQCPVIVPEEEEEEDEDDHPHRSLMLQESTSLAAVFSNDDDL